MTHIDIFWREIDEVTVNNWTDDDLADCEEFRIIAADVEARKVSESVIKEAHDCMTRDWCSGKIKTAFIDVIARNGGFDKFDDNAIYSRRPRTKVIDGQRYIIG